MLLARQLASGIIKTGRGFVPGFRIFGRIHMGELIVMPVRTATEAADGTGAAPQTAQSSDIDFSVWKTAPRERTAAYFPTYSTISKAMQTAMRGWVREWFAANPEVL